MPGLYNQKVTPKLQHYIDQDESRTSLCALFFVKKGFPFVSILDGGFVQAHAWLCREGPKRHLDATSVLVDYDEDNSFFGKLEKTYRTQQEMANATTGEKAQHVMQNFLDSSMTALARTARRMEEVTAEFESEYSSEKAKSARIVTVPEEVEEEEAFVGSPTSIDSDKDGKDTTQEGSEGNFVTRFAGKLHKRSESKDAGIEADENVDSKEKEEPAGGEAEAKFKNPLDRFRKAEADGETEKTEGDAGNAPVFRNPFAARRSVVPEKEETVEKAEDKTQVKEEQAADETDLVDVTIATAESNKPGRFSGLAKAARSSIQKVGEQQSAGGPNPLKRNPFARFGGGANKPVEKKPQPEKKPGNRFGGINMNNIDAFRKNTMSSLRAKAGGGDAAASEAEHLVEESISFDFDATAATPTAPSTSEEEKTKEAAVVESV